MARLPPPEHTRWKKGVSANPGGRPRVKGDLAKITDLTNVELKKLITKYFRMDKNAVKEVGESTTLPMIDVAIARTIFRASQSGDFHKLLPLIERVCGKVKDVMEVIQPEPVIIQRSDGTEIELGTRIVEAEIVN